MICMNIGMLMIFLYLNMYVKLTWRVDCFVFKNTRNTILTWEKLIWSPRWRCWWRVSSLKKNWIIIFLHAWLEGSIVLKACFVGLLSSQSFVCRCKDIEVFTRCEICFFCSSRSLGHPVVVCNPVVVNSCCWQYVKQVQMKILWSTCNFTLVWATLDQWSRQRNSNYLLWPSQ